MSNKIFQDNIFPKHVADLMTEMHMLVFNGNNGDEEFETYLTIEQKECVALGLALYYQCNHCINHHLKVLSKLRKVKPESLMKNMASIILFLRTDLRGVTIIEQDRWKQAWDQFAHKLFLKRGDKLSPWLIGLAVGIARDDNFLIEFMGSYVTSYYIENIREILGELESVTIYMKSAVSKNRIADKLESLIVGDFP